MKKLSENTINITKKVLNERANKEPEQLDELLGGLKRLFGKPGSPEDQAVLDYIAEFSKLTGFPELMDTIKRFNKPTLIKRGIKGSLDFRELGQVAAYTDQDKNKVSVKNVNSYIQKAIEKLENLQMAAQGKMFKATAGLMMRLLSGYKDQINKGERGRQRDAMDSARRTVSRQAAADRGTDRSRMNKRIRNL